MNHRRTLAAALACAAMTLTATAPAQTPAAAPLKIGFVYVSPVGDAGWTSQHDMARKAMEQALAGKVVTQFVENVPEGPDAERVIRELAQKGNGLIFTTSFGFMNPTLKVAQQFPKVKFEHATGYKTAANVGTYNARFYEGRYLAGIVAGRMTKTNVAGYVAAFPIPEVVMGINAFTRGMRSVNPKAEVKVVWTSSWYDPGKERQASETLVSQGADVLTHHTDSTATVQAAEAKQVYAIAYHSDMTKYGPHAQLTAVTHVWDRVLHAGRAIGARRHVEARPRVGRHQGRHDPHGTVQRGGAEERAGRDAEGAGRHRRRQAEPVQRADEGQRRQAAARRRGDDDRRGDEQDGLLRRGRAGQGAHRQVTARH